MYVVSGLLLSRNKTELKKNVMLIFREPSKAIPDSMMSNTFHSYSPNPSSSPAQLSIGAFTLHMFRGSCEADMKEYPYDLLVSVTVATSVVVLTLKFSL